MHAFNRWVARGALLLAVVAAGFAPLAHARNADAGQVNFGPC